MKLKRGIKNMWKPSKEKLIEMAKNLNVDLEFVDKSYVLINGKKIRGFQKAYWHLYLIKKQRNLQ